jgi:hypothetical protein
MHLILSLNNCGRFIFTYAKGEDKKSSTYAVAVEDTLTFKDTYSSHQLTNIICTYAYWTTHHS